MVVIDILAVVMGSNVVVFNVTVVGETVVVERTGVNTTEVNVAFVCVFVVIAVDIRLFSVLEGNFVAVNSAVIAG